MKTGDQEKLRVAVGADHGGFLLKQELVSRLQEKYEILDLAAVIGGGGA